MLPVKQDNGKYIVMFLFLILRLGEAQTSKNNAKELFQAPLKKFKNLCNTAYTCGESRMLQYGNNHENESLSYILRKNK